MTRHHHATRPDAIGGPATMLSRADLGLLLAFYTALDPAEQRARFGGRITAAALSRHCRGLDWTHAVVPAWMAGDRIVAIAEIHLDTPAHPAVELAVACQDPSQRQPTWRDAIRLAAAAAGRRGCRTLHVVADPLHGFVPALLQASGQVRAAAGLWTCTLAPR